MYTCVMLKQACNALLCGYGVGGGRRDLGCLSVLVTLAEGLRFDLMGARKKRL